MTLSLISCGVVAMLAMAGCLAHGDDSPAPAPTATSVVVVDAGRPDSAFPSFGLLDHSCDFSYNGRICNDMISVDHYDVPDLVLVQYTMSCKDPAVTNNTDQCMLWSMRDSKGQSFGYPDYWAWCCIPPDAGPVIK